MDRFSANNIFSTPTIKEVDSIVPGGNESLDLIDSLNQLHKNGLCRSLLCSTLLEDERGQVIA